MLGLDIVYMHAKFHHSNLSHSRDMAGDHQNLNGSRDLTMPLSGMVCHPSATTTKVQRPYKMAKIGWFEVVMGHSRSLKIMHMSSY